MASIPDLLGMDKVISEDALRNALKRIPEAQGCAWLDGHLSDSVTPLLNAPWILDTDTTVKPLYGHQEGAVIGYNPKKPGAPRTATTPTSWLVCGRCWVWKCVPETNTRPSHAQPGLLKVLDDLAPGRKPKLVRGDNAFGNDSMMTALEARGAALPVQAASSRRTSSATLAVCSANRAGRMPARVGRARMGSWCSMAGRSVVASSCCAGH